MLQSMSNGVMTLDPDNKIVTANAAALRIWEKAEGDLVGKVLTDVLGEDCGWVLDQLERAKNGHDSFLLPDANMSIGAVSKSVNVTFTPLLAAEGESALGSMLMFEDISSEKRMKSRMSRYMDPVIAAQMLEGEGLDFLGEERRKRPSCSRMFEALRP